MLPIISQLTVVTSCDGFVNFHLSVVAGSREQSADTLTVRRGVGVGVAVGVGVSVGRGVAVLVAVGV